MKRQNNNKIIVYAGIVLVGPPFSVLRRTPKNEVMSLGYFLE